MYVIHLPALSPAVAAIGNMISTNEVPIASIKFNIKENKEGRSPTLLRRGSEKFVDT
jgi:hypothetical protein